MDTRADIALAVDPANGRHLFELDGARLHESVDGGASWRTTPADRLPRARRNVRLAYARGGVLLAAAPGSGQGVLQVRRSTDRGRSWQRLALPGGGYARQVAVRGTSRTAYAALVARRPGLYRSLDGGATWRLTGLRGRPVGAVATGPGRRLAVAIVGARATSPTRILVSDDDGRTFRDVGGLPVSTVELMIDNATGAVYAHDLRSAPASVAGGSGSWRILAG